MQAMITRLGAPGQIVSSPGASKDEVGVLSGYAIRYNTWAVIAEHTDVRFLERIERGAFGDLEQRDVLCLFSHRWDVPLGRLSNGTLSLREDPQGIFFQCRLPNTSAGRDLWELATVRTIQGCSFGAIPQDVEFSADRRRAVIKQAVLCEVSPCAAPSYTTTTAQVA